VGREFTLTRKMSAAASTRALKEANLRELQKKKWVQDRDFGWSPLYWLEELVLIPGEHSWSVIRTWLKLSKTSWQEEGNSKAESYAHIIHSPRISRTLTFNHRSITDAQSDGEEAGEKTGQRKGLPYPGSELARHLVRRVQPVQVLEDEHFTGAVATAYFVDQAEPQSYRCARRDGALPE
jgi:hypothetical protein